MRGTPPSKNQSPPPAYHEYSDHWWNSEEEPSQKEIELDKLRNELADEQFALLQAQNKQISLKNLLDGERQKRNIFFRAVENVRQGGRYPIPHDLARRYFTADGGVQEYKRMKRYNKNYQINPIIRRLAERQARIDYYNRYEVHPEEDGLKWDPDTESWVPQ
jgi:hypothetical protein